MKATLKFIGHINTPYNSIEDCPNNIDPNGLLCQLIIDNDFKDGLLGLVPALRSPHRPNLIGAAVVSIETIERGSVFVNGLDCLNGTHL